MLSELSGQLIDQHDHERSLFLHERVALEFRAIVCLLPFHHLDPVTWIVSSLSFSQSVSFRRFDLIDAKRGDTN